LTASGGDLQLHGPFPARRSALNNGNALAMGIP
jgi:hypothetical protein